MDEQTLELQRIANCVEAMVNKYIKEPITITYEKQDDSTIGEFSEWDRHRFTILGGDELYFIRRGRELLYTVCVSADSYLTAAEELINLIARKF